MSIRSKIAIIDDDESMCRSIGRLLQLAGLPSVSFASAEAFLSNRLRNRFGCLLVDVQLTGMSGIELGRLLAAHGPTTPIIYITAYDDPETRVEALSSGCAGFFRKTDPGPDIIAAIRRALRARDDTI